MRIALLADRSDIHTVRWVNGLAQRGHSIHLLTMQSGGDPIHHNVTLYQLRYSSPYGYYANALQLRWKLSQIQPDLFHAHFASGYGTLGRLGGVRPYLLSVWGRDVYEFPYRSYLHKKVLLRNLNAADHLCSTSHAMAKQTKLLDGDLDSISITPFGVNSNTFCPKGTQKNMGWVHDSEALTVIGTVKKLDTKYGIDVLIRSFAQLCERLKKERPKQVESLRLVIVGDGPLREELDKLSRDCGIEKQTTFVGAVPHAEVPAYLRSFDIYAALSRSNSESFGVAIIEASACGLPVVVTDVGGLPEVVRDKKTGFVVPHEDAEAAATALSRLVQNPCLRKSMGKAGRDYVIENYEWSACLERMEMIYQDLVRGDGRSLPIQ